MVTGSATKAGKGRSS